MFFFGYERKALLMFQQSILRMIKVPKLGRVDEPRKSRPNSQLLLGILKLHELESLQNALVYILSVGIYV